MNNNDLHELWLRAGVPLALFTSLLLLLTLQPITVYPQSIFGALRGSVTDSNGAAVANAAVKVINQDQSVARAAVTDAGGKRVGQLALRLPF